MSINVKVYDNGDHTCLVWLPADGKPIPGCRGFTARRIQQGKPDFYLHGFVGFSDDDKLDPAAPWKHPVQRYMWWDYGVRPGDVVQYSVVPVVGADKDHLTLSTADASALTPPMTVSGQATPKVAAYFNKGIVAAQWVSRALAALGDNAEDGRPHRHVDPPGDALRNALSGLLRPQILAMLDEVKKNNGEIYAALYELNDPELIEALKGLGKKCHLILANGAFKPPDNDENKDIRGEVGQHRRSARSHRHERSFRAQQVRRLLRFQRQAAARSLRQHQLDHDGPVHAGQQRRHRRRPGSGGRFPQRVESSEGAGNGYPPTLAAANSTAKTFKVDGGRITQWFAPTSGAQDLDMRAS